MLKESLMDEVLSYCMKNLNSAGFIHKPVNFTSNFHKAAPTDVFAALFVLHDRECIDLKMADFPESQNIYTISILPGAHEYFISKDNARAEFRKNWRWNIWAAVVTALVSALLGLLLSRTVEHIWPVHPPIEAGQEQSQQ